MTQVINNLPTYISDAHTLVWYLTEDKKLGRIALSILESVDNDLSILIIPAVVLAELYMIAEKKRTSLGLVALGNAIQNWQTADNIRLTNLTPELVILSSQFSAIPEIFDRLIVTEAHKLGVPLITRDPLIVNSNLVPTLW